MENCIFCQIAEGELDAEICYQDQRIIVFKDVNPQAPVHLLAIPRRHIASLDELQKEEDYQLLPHLFRVINSMAREEGLEERGFRVVVNCGEEGGQTVSHLHFHLLGGRQLEWPPG